MISKERIIISWVFKGGAAPNDTAIKLLFSNSSLLVRQTGCCTSCFWGKSTLEMTCLWVLNARESILISKNGTAFNLQKWHFIKCILESYNKLVCMCSSWAYIKLLLSLYALKRFILAMSYEDICQLTTEILIAF